MNKQAFLLAACACAGFALPLPILAFGADFAVEVVAIGDEFKGYPKYEFKVDDRLIASGEVTARRDSDGQVLRFKVEGDPASLSFSFINDLYEKGVGDRNLVIKNFAINGQSVAEDRFSSDHESRKFNMASATTITLRRPDSGWSLIQTTSKEPGAAEVTAPSEVSPTAIGQAASSTESAPSDTANTCSAAQFFVQFARSSLAVSKEDFVPVLAAAKAPGCRIRVVGYADRSGPTQLNKSISEARAKAVADLLIGGGIDEDSITVEGRGETQEFGTAAANRRVAISVEP